MIDELKNLLKEKIKVDKELIDTHKCRFMGILETYLIRNKKITMLKKETGGSVIIPIDNEGNVYLETQYRFPINRVLLEAPAGKLDNKDEAYIDCARRELLEETGCEAEKIIELIRYNTKANFTNEEIAIFLAKGVRQVKEQKLDSDENVNVLKMPLNVAIELIKDGTIIDQRTIVGIGLAKLEYNREKNKFDKNQILNKIKEDQKTLFEEKIGENYRYEKNNVLAIDNIVKIPNGETSFREVFYLKPSEIVIPIKDDKIGFVLKDMPIIEKKEIVFLENYKGLKTYLGEQATAVGYADEVAKMYVTVENVENCIYLEGKEIIELIKAGYIRDGLTLAALFKVFIDFDRYL